MEKKQNEFIPSQELLDAAVTLKKRFERFEERQEKQRAKKDKRAEKYAKKNIMN